MSRLPSVTDDTFAEKVLEAPGTVLVDFWAAWCQPCLKMAPVLEELAAELGGITIVTLDVDDNPDTAQAYGVVSIPTLAAYRGGELLATLVGARPKPALAAELSALAS